MALLSSAKVPTANLSAASDTCSAVWEITPGRISPTVMVKSPTATNRSFSRAINTGWVVLTWLMAIRYPMPSMVSTASMAPVNFMWSENLGPRIPERLRSKWIRQA